MRLRLGLGWLVLAGSTVSGLAAAAGPPDAERLKIAAEEFDAGRRAFKVKDFESAAVHFENADRDAPSPEALQSAMRARKEAGQMARSATLGAWGASRYPNDKPFNDYARQILTEADKTLHRVTLSCQPDCNVIVDNKVMPFPESASATVYLDPGPHAIVAGWSNNRHRNSDVSAVAGGNSKLVFNAATSDKPAEPAGNGHDNANPGDTPADRPADDKKGGLPPVVFIISAGVTAVLGGVTIWSGIDTVNNPGTEALKECERTVGCNWKALYDEGVAHQNRTNVLLGVTGVAAVTTGVIALFFTNWGDDAPQGE
ncbi:MAG: hypothetical protein ABW133_11990, partial [Polyangiaceae bacterium]